MDKILVLLVDDHPLVAEGMRRMLAKDQTIAFHYVGDPTQAIEVISKVAPTVILQDLVMPGVNGLDLLKLYREDSFIGAIPVIVLSSTDDAATIQLAFESGANDYMVKLPDQIELLARVRMHSEAYFHELERQRAYRQLEASQRELTENNLELKLVNQKLNEAHRFKAEFFGNVSHEIRTPLIGVIGVTEMLADTTMNPYQSELLEVVRGSGETLLHIINDILDLSKIETGKLQLESSPFILRDALDQGMDLLAPMAFGKGLEISAWIDPRIPSTVVGDITRFRQIVLLLLNNAIKFTSSGEIYLQIEPWGEGQGIIHFWVEDTGIGIPQEKLDRLFRSFSQADASTARGAGGTGLGCDPGVSALPQKTDTGFSVFFKLMPTVPILILYPQCFCCVQRSIMSIKPSLHGIHGAGAFMMNVTGRYIEFGAGERSLLKHSRKPYRAEDLGKACSRRFEQNNNSQDGEDIVQMLKGWELLAKESDSRCEVLIAEQTPNEAPETVIPPDREVAQTDPSSKHGGLTRQLAGRHFFCKSGIFERYGSPQRYR